jgi:hypothetical protein
MNRCIAPLALAAVLACPAGAYATTVSPTTDQYGNPVAGAVDQPAAVAESGDVAGLPFTGMELGMLAGAGGLALLAGGAIRLIARRDDASRDGAAS